MANPILDAARLNRATADTELKTLIAAVSARPETERSLTTEETATFEQLAASIDGFDKQIDLLTAEEKRTAAAAAAVASAENNTEFRDGANVTVKRERLTYEQHDPSASFFRDLGTLATAHMGASDVDGARQRLAQHSKEMVIESRKLEGQQRRDFERFLDQPGASYEKRTNPNTTDGTGGEFVPPTWLVGQYIPFARPTRTFANRVTNLPLPPGTDQINLPKIITGTSTAIQTANAAAVSSTDFTTSTVSAGVKTIAGQEDISMQLLEQAPINMDQVIFDDLSRDYDQRLDIQVVMGTNANGQHKGILLVTTAASNTDISKTNSVVATSATFDNSAAAGQYRSIVSAVNTIETVAFDAPTAIWVHPRRANHWSTAVDSTNRPLFLKASYGLFNAYGATNDGPPIAQGFAGELFGLPVIKDPNMSVTMTGTTATGGSADPIIVLNEQNIYLWEGALKMRALPEILSGTLQIRFQVYAYSAFMPDRLPCSISVVTGNTGLAAPSF